MRTEHKTETERLSPLRSMFDPQCARHLFALVVLALILSWVARTLLILAAWLLLFLLTAWPIALGLIRLVRIGHSEILLRYPAEKQRAPFMRRSEIKLLKGASNLRTIRI
jgi:hypothetical protein